ncbi:glycosyltransferase family 4 protein [Paracidobacterium acidisoli]|uniref:Glycosyltransferase family 1 protein n=1 Tax=Paracidobacterium acidisoli TaxID=2303751 RepID=A0A372ISS3_9BACT|nr:glycosyltransferase family 4 protein [Paracidobacterium acidisoli]MBT9330420.1 glycosyltransferase family 4 protein [Paracidobacterium acidisoli]
MAQIPGSAKLQAPRGTQEPRRTARLAYFVSHPIQYQVPLLRRIAAEADIDLQVFYFSDLSVRGYNDAGFGGVRVEWDIPLLDGYKSEFLPGFRHRDSFSFASPVNHGIFSRLRRGHFDAVWLHGYHTMSCLQVLFAAKLLGLPLFLRTDSSLNDRVRSTKTLLAKKLFFGIIGSAVSGILSVGKANDDYWQEALGANVRIFPMPYAVDNDFFHCQAVKASAGREAFRSELGLEPGRPVLLFASKLQGRKRCIDLVEAYLRLSSAPGRPRPYLLIVGNGEERQAVEARAAAAADGDIRFLGFRNQTELPRFFDLCDIFVLPSIHEPYGLVINEVMNASRTVVVSDQVGCHPDLVHDGLNGRVFPAENIDALAECLQQLLDQPDLRESMGRNSLRLIQHFTFEQDVAGLRQALAFAVPGFHA